MIKGAIDTMVTIDHAHTLFKRIFGWVVFDASWLLSTELYMLTRTHPGSDMVAMCDNCWLLYV